MVYAGRPAVLTQSYVNASALMVGGRARFGLMRYRGDHLPGESPTMVWKPPQNMR